MQNTQSTIFFGTKPNSSSNSNATFVDSIIKTDRQCLSFKLDDFITAVKKQCTDINADFISDAMITTSSGGSQHYVCTTYTFTGNAYRYNNTNNIDNSTNTTSTSIFEPPFYDTYDTKSHKNKK